MYRVDENSLIAAGRRIQHRRQQMNMTQEALAEACDVNTSFISQVETGASQARLQTYLRMANVLHMTLDDIFCDSYEGNDLLESIDAHHVLTRLSEFRGNERQLIIRMVDDLCDGLLGLLPKDK